MQRLLNDTLYQVMLYSESDTAAQVLKCLSEIDTELAKLDMIRDGQRKATESLNEEFKETLDVLVNRFFNHSRVNDLKIKSN